MAYYMIHSDNMHDGPELIGTTTTLENAQEIARREVLRDSQRDVTITDQYGYDVRVDAFIVDHIFSDFRCWVDGGTIYYHAPEYGGVTSFHGPEAGRPVRRGDMCASVVYARGVGGMLVPLVWPTSDPVAAAKWLAAEKNGRFCESVPMTA